MHASVVDGLLQKCDWPGGYGQCDLADMSDIIIT